MADITCVPTSTKNQDGQRDPEMHQAAKGWQWYFGMKAHVGVDGRTNEVEKAKNRNKSRVRAKVEHVFGVIKNVFGFRKARYRGLAKNLQRLEVAAALANLYIVRRRLLKA